MPFPKTFSETLAQGYPQDFCEALRTGAKVRECPACGYCSYPGTYDADGEEVCPKCREPFGKGGAE